MQYRAFSPLGGQTISALCLGTGPMGSDIDRDTSFSMLDAFVDMGGNFLDTARMYGQGASERTLGAWMAARKNRARLVIGTKGGFLAPDGSPRLDRRSLESDLRESLEALGTDRVDLYWLHRDDPARPVSEILETLNRFLEEGRVRAIGASNWSLPRLQEAEACASRQGLTGFCATQPQWSLARQEADHEATLVYMDKALYRFQAQKGLPCIPFSSQAKGFFQKLSRGGEAALPPKAKTRFLSAHNLRLYEELRRIERETGMAPGVSALAFLTGQPFPVFPIAGASSLSQAEALRDAADARLQDKDMRALLALSGYAD